MSTRFYSLVCFVWVSLGLSLPAVANVQVHEVRLWRAPDHTRIVFDLTGPASHKLITLENPHRIVLDVKDTSLKTKLSSLQLDGTPISKIRSGVREGDDLRVVLDLSAAVKPKSFELQANDRAGDRLVLDIYDIDSKPDKVKKTVKQSSRRNIIVAIDAGHGGEDPGATGKSRTREKDVVLALARELKKTIDAQPGMTGVLTRDGDYYIPLRDRFEKARTHRADLFVSIHADAFKNRKVSGSSVFVLSRKGASSEFARRLAASENSSDLVGGVTLNDKDEMLASVLLDLSQSATMEASNAVADSVFGSLRVLGKTHKNHVEHANFMVLKSPDVPSILVETAFISNPSEEKRLKDPAWQRRTARVITDGIQDYFYMSPPPGTWIAANRQPVRYRVVRGDTLGEIASRYRVSLYSLRRVNGLKTDNIRIGSELLIPTT